MVVYVNAEQKKVISPKEYEELLNRSINEADNQESFIYWLENTYTLEEVWNFTDEEKVSVREEFMNALFEAYADSLAQKWIPMLYNSNI